MLKGLRWLRNTRRGFVYLAGIFWNVIGLVGANESAQAKGWGLGVGYHNPVSSDAGISLLYLWESVAFEAALGAVGLWGNDDSSGMGLGGDADLKWLFGGKIKGYLQGGFGYGVGASTEGAAIGVGGPFAGAGIFLIGSRFYCQVGGDYIFNASSAQLTGTVGLFL